MFGFLGMLLNYSSRKIARYEDSKSGLAIDTCSVSDSDLPYETAVKHPLYHDKKWIVVEDYETEEEAIEGHAKWESIMCSDKLPDSLEDISTCEVAKILRKSNKGHIIHKREK